MTRVQQSLILEDRVIHGVLNDSVIQLSAFPLINESRDPVAEIRRRLKFEISPDSDCAFVSFEIDRSEMELAYRLRFDRVNETPMIRSANWRVLYGIVAPLGSLLLVLGGAPRSPTAPPPAS